MSRSGPASWLVVVVTMGTLMIRTSEAVTCYSCGPQVTSHCSDQINTPLCQEDDLARVLDNGTCSVPHHAQYCGPVDWCVKTWRGNSGDNMTGDTSRGLDCVWAHRGHLQTD